MLFMELFCEVLRGLQGIHLEFKLVRISQCVVQIPHLRRFSLGYFLYLVHDGFVLRATLITLHAGVYSAGMAKTTTNARMAATVTKCALCRWRTLCS
jgi:hypothetical protein